MLILTPSWVPRFPRNPLGGQNKHFTQLYNGLFDLIYFRISIIIVSDYNATAFEIYYRFGSPELVTMYNENTKFL